MSGPNARSRPTSRLELDERWARAAWAFLTEPRDAGVTRLLGECGAVEALVRLRAGRLPSRSGWDVRLPELDLDGLARAARHHRVHVLVPGDPQWPAGLDRLHEPPYCLFVRGDPDLGALAERSVAIVGSRAATEYGLRVAADLADGLAARGFTVVSGAAYGVDSAAHRAALAADPGKHVGPLAWAGDAPGQDLEVSDVGRRLQPHEAAVDGQRHLCRRLDQAWLGRCSRAVPCGLQALAHA